MITKAYQHLKYNVFTMKSKKKKFYTCTSKLMEGYFSIHFILILCHHSLNVLSILKEVFTHSPLHRLRVLQQLSSLGLWTLYNSLGAGQPPAFVGPLHNYTHSQYHQIFFSFLLSI